MKKIKLPRKPFANIAKTILLFLASYLIYTGCIKKTADEEIDIKLDVSEPALSFSYTGGEQKTFNIMTNYNWAVEKEAGATWLHFESATSGSINDGNNQNVKITVKADPNPETASRTATITVSNDIPIVENKTISVTQEAVPFSNYTETSNSLNFEMIAVQGGTFSMGCTSEQGSDCYYDEMPAHQVTLSDFYIGKYEVTQGLWKTVMGNNPSYFTGGDNYPVEYMFGDDIVGTSGSYQEIKGIRYYANGFIYKLNQLTGKQYRLPTEAEWEYAARGGANSKGYKYSGSNIVGNVAWCSENSDSRTHPVGGKAANELGIYDMSGNVCELCSDWYDSYSSNVQTNPTGPTSGPSRVYRGGSWSHPAWYTRVSYRNFWNTGFYRHTVGLRLARSSN